MDHVKLYKQRFEVEILTRTPKDYDDLASMAYDMTDGDVSGFWRELEQQELTGEAAVKAVYAQGSDPAFFGMDDEGNESED